MDYLWLIMGGGFIAFALTVLGVEIFMDLNKDE